MTEKELLRHQVADAGYQLEKVFEGIEDESLDFRIIPQAMTPREILVHLSETYYAVIAETAGKKHEWGSYVPEDTKWPGLWHNFLTLRQRAIEAALDTPDWCENTSAYIVAHDYYHVGQMCLMRMARDATFNTYAIYKG